MSFQITERDIKLLYNINGFGFVNIDYVMRLCNWHQRLAYRRLKKLVDHGFLIYERIFYQQPGVYRLTPKGAGISGDSLSALRKINIATYRHDALLSGLALSLTSGQLGDFTTERRIRADNGISLFNTKQHVPDGLFKHNGEVIAIELELTVKSKRRLEKIIQHYRRDINIDEVWYFTDSEQVNNKLQKVFDAADNVKFLPLGDYVK